MFRLKELGFLGEIRTGVEKVQNEYRTPCGSRKFTFSKKCTQKSDGNKFKNMGDGLEGDSQGLNLRPIQQQNYDSNGL